MRTRIRMTCPCGATFKGGRFDPWFRWTEAEPAHELAATWAREHADHADEASEAIPAAGLAELQERLRLRDERGHGPLGKMT